MALDREHTKQVGDAWWIIGLVFVATCLRIPGISASFYGDEEFSLLRDSNYLLTPTEDRFRPIFFSLLYLWRQLGFHSEAGLRSLPLIFGVLQVPVAFKLGRLLGGRPAAITFAALIALNPMLIEFSQELRMYSLVPLLALLQAWSFTTVAERSSAGRSTLWPWVGFVVAGVAGVYTHFHYWFLIGGFAIAALRRRRDLPLKESAPALATIVLLYLPDVPNLLRFQREAASAAHLRATDLPSALPKLIAAICVGFNYFKLPRLGIDRAVRGSVLTANVALSALVAVPVVVVVWYLVRLHREPKTGAMLWLSHELFTVPVVASFAAVLVMGRDFIHPKYMVFSAPFLLLLATAGYLAIPGRPARAVVAATSIGVFLIAFVHFNEPREYGRREDCRGVTTFLRSALADDDVVLQLVGPDAPETVTTTDPPRSLWDYYGGDLASHIRVVRMPRAGATIGELRPMVDRLTAGKHHVYYVWAEITANQIDPGDTLVETARAAFVDEQRVQYNPRVVMYSWSTR